MLFFCITLLIQFFLFRPLLLQYGLFEQLCVDHGTEFCLCIFVQELLKNKRGNISRAPWRQTKSTENYRAEGLWPEENARVNYPLKRALCFVKEQEIFNMEDPLVIFAVSWVTRNAPGALDPAVFLLLPGGKICYGHSTYEPKACKF